MVGRRAYSRNEQLNQNPVIRANKTKEDEFITVETTFMEPSEKRFNYI